MGIIEPQQRAQTVVMVQILNGVLKVFHFLQFMVFKVPYYTKLHVHIVFWVEKKILICFNVHKTHVSHTVHIQIFTDFYIYLIPDTSGKTLIQSLLFHTRCTAQTLMMGCHEEKNMQPHLRIQSFL